jgi:hypothetical protein
MKTPANAVENREQFRPLEQLELEAQARVNAAMASLDEEFSREFGSSRSHAGEFATGDQPWSGFLDLATL